MICAWCNDYVMSSNKLMKDIEYRKYIFQHFFLGFCTMSGAILFAIVNSPRLILNCSSGGTELTHEKAESPNHISPIFWERKALSYRNIWLRLWPSFQGFLSFPGPPVLYSPLHAKSTLSGKVSIMRDWAQTQHVQLAVLSHLRPFENSAWTDSLYS